jgi:hypothetical protein
LHDSTINKRLKKMEQGMGKGGRKEAPKLSEILRYEVWRDGTPKTEEDARIKAEAGKIPKDGFIHAIILRDPHIPGEDEETFRREYYGEQNES